MTTHPFDFAAEMTLYKRTNDSRRKDVFFYARPVTMRRGFELGCMVLADVKKRRPDIRIHMAGWDVSEWKVPFEYVNHGAMSLEELSPLYNKCAVALVMSLTNLSLLPLELASCGTIPVVNDAPNNRLVSDNPCIDTFRSRPAPWPRRSSVSSMPPTKWSVRARPPPLPPRSAGKTPDASSSPILRGP